MDNSFDQPIVDVKKLELKDSRTKEKLDKEFNYKFYIPPFEKREDSKSGINWELVNDQNYIESSKLVGTINDIVVSVCPDDPLKADEVSIYRIHGRVMDGRTRYLSSQKAGIVWPVRYIKVKDFEQFIWLWSHFNSLKGGNKLDEINKFLQLCMWRNKNGMEKSEVGQSIVRQYGNNHPFNSDVLRRIILKEFKRKYDLGDVESPAKTKPNEAPEPAEPERKVFKKDKEISRKDLEIHDLNQQNFELQDQVKVLSAKNKDFHDLIPFITTPQKVTAKNKDVTMTVYYDLDSREIIVNVD